MNSYQSNQKTRSNTGRGRGVSRNFSAEKQDINIRGENGKRNVSVDRG